MSASCGHPVCLPCYRTLVGFPPAPSPAPAIHDHPAGFEAEEEEVEGQEQEQEQDQEQEQQDQEQEVDPEPQFNDRGKCPLCRGSLPASRWRTGRHIR